ncbi:MAG: hypothetical protein RL685_115 [Pseudomonadota bacterium]
MAEQSPPERDVVSRHLAGAWRSFTPEASLQDRVRARLTSSAAATLGTVGTGMALQPRPEATLTSLQASSKLGMAAVGAGLIGIGLLSGYLLRGAQQAPAAPVTASALSAPAPAPALPAEVSAPSAQPAPVSEAPVALPAPRASRPVRQRARAPVPQTEASSVAPAASEPSEELALLRRAERAVRGADSALALALIAELEQRYPRSSLLEERRAVELLAYCAAGASDARARAERFLREHPRSVHAGRIAESCADAGELSTTQR